MKLDHLTEVDHAELAQLLTEVQAWLLRTTRIVDRAPWTDRVLRVAKATQERLIDPARDAHSDLLRRNNPSADSSDLYPSVGYGA